MQVCSHNFNEKKWVLCTIKQRIHLRDNLISDIFLGVNGRNIVSC